MRWKRSSKWKWHRKGLSILTGVVALLVLAACSGSLPAQEAAPEGPVQGSEIGTEAVLPPDSPATDTPVVVEETAASPLSATATAVSEPEAIPTAGESVSELAAPPPVREGLEATDPSTVQLASGGLQLVEFFAFW